MERKSNEQEIKDFLQEKLQKITLSENEHEIVVTGNGDDEVFHLNKNESEKFGFKHGDFVQIIFGFPCHRRNEIAICVGVGVGCPRNPERKEMWFLIEEDDGVSHFCKNEKEDFEKTESEGDLLRL